MAMFGYNYVLVLASTFTGKSSNTKFSICFMKWQKLVK